MLFLFLHNSWKNILLLLVSTNLSHVAPITSGLSPISSYMSCIELPTPPLSLSVPQAGWGIEMEEVVADERWQESLHSGWLSEDVKWALVPQWRITAGREEKMETVGPRKKERKKLKCEEEECRFLSKAVWPFQNILACVHSVVPCQASSRSSYCYNYSVYIAACRGKRLSK